MAELEIIKFVGAKALEFWWVIAPIILFFILQELWLAYKTTKYLSELTWILLEVRLPRATLKATKAMDHILTALHVIHAGEIKFAEKYFEGKVQEWFSLEVVGRADGVKFLLYLPDKFRNLVEAQIYAHYPDAEIIEVDDYTQYLPVDIPTQEYDVWGAELVLTKADAYPILTYQHFEDIKEERTTDPLSSLLETLSLLKEGEQAWVQILAKPVDDKFNKWKEEGEKEVAKLAGRKVAIKAPIFDLGGVFEGIADTISGSSAAAAEKKEEREKVKLTPGEEIIAKAIEANIAKFGYETQIRMLYIAETSIFSKAQGAALLGSFKQFNTQHLNGFKPGEAARLKAKWYDFDKEAVVASKKRELVRLYKQRAFRKPFPFIFTSSKNPYTFVLSTEELATVYHLPTAFVEAPAVVRIEAKKGEPPPILPVL